MQNNNNKNGNNNNNKNGNNKKNNKNSITMAITYFLIALAFVMVFNYTKNSESTQKISYNEFIKLLNDKEISQVVITSSELIITPSENNEEYKGKILNTVNINDESLIPALKEAGIDFNGELPKQTPIMNFALSFLEKI